MNRKLVSAFGCFFKACVYGCIALLIGVQLMNPNLNTANVLSVNDLFAITIPKKFLQVSLLAAVFEVFNSINNIPKVLK